MVRVEDLDPPRVVPGSATRILEDLEWLGLDWDEGPGRGPLGPYEQSRRGSTYAAAVAALDRQGLVYPCDCSRAEIARVASAPHEGEEVVYPGTCRNADPNRTFKRDPAMRVRIPRESEVSFDDRFAGHVSQRLATAVGDFVLVRGDGVFAYQLAVVLDDLAMGITDVIRGADLLSSTPRQLWLAEKLRAAGVIDPAIQNPRYAHLPLVVDGEGRRLAKRSPGAHVRQLREAGLEANAILGVLTHALGLQDDTTPITAAAVSRIEASELRPRALVVPNEWAATGGT